MGDDLSELLHDSARAGVYGLSLPTAMIGAAARHAGLHFVDIDLSETDDKAALLATIAAELNFPDWFGGNWDALEDCLMDLSWIDAAGYVIVLRNCDELIAQSPDDFTVALEVCDGAATFWHETEHPFWVFIGCEDPGEFELPLLGA